MTKILTCMSLKILMKNEKVRHKEHTQNDTVKSYKLYLFQGFLNVQEKFNIPIHAWRRLKIKSSPVKITECTTLYMRYENELFYYNSVTHDRKEIFIKLWSFSSELIWLTLRIFRLLWFLICFQVVSGQTEIKTKLELVKFWNKHVVKSTGK